MLASFEKVAPGTGRSFRTLSIQAPAFEHGFHFHPEVEITWIQSGRGRRFVGDSMEPFGPDDLVVLGGHLPHRYYTEPSPGDPGDAEGPEGMDPNPATASRASVIQFTPDAIGRQVFELPEMSGVQRLLQMAKRGLAVDASPARRLGPQVHAVTQATGPERVVRLLGLLVDLSRVRTRPLSSPGFLPNPRGDTMDRIERVIAYVHECFQDSIRLEGAARRAAMTPPALSRWFRRTTGTTFTQFVNDVRIGHACRLLADTDRTISDIAFTCGYGTLSNFNLHFKRLRGHSPKAFRQAARDR